MDYFEIVTLSLTYMGMLRLCSRYLPVARLIHVNQGVHYMVVL